MSRGHYRVGAEGQETGGSWGGYVVAIGVGLGIGWLWFGRDKREAQALERLIGGPYVADIERAIRARGVDPRHYGLSGR